MTTAQWTKAVDRAILAGVDPDTLPASPFLERMIDDLIERLTHTASFAFCGHVLFDASLGELPDMIAFPADAWGSCLRCAVVKHNQLAAKPPPCHRCDAARATGLFQASLGAAEEQIVGVLAFALCDACAVAEGLRDGAETALPGMLQ